MSLDLERPAALALLLAPALLWFLARVRPEPPALATGALALWRESGAPPAERRAPARRALSLALRFALVALVLGALAAAGPRLRAARAPRVFVALVDASPSTSLLLPDGRTRLAAALSRAQEWLAAHGHPGDRVLWRSSARGPLELALGAEPPADWLAPPPFFAPEPEFAREDRAGTLWITDRLAREPAQAVAFASGGPAVPGPVACAGRTRIDWDGSALVEVEDALASRPAALRAGSAGVPRELAELLALWARERGLGLDPEASAPALALEGGPVGAERELEAGREGWSARGAALAAGLAPAPADGPLVAPWLEAVDPAGARTTLVLVEPGRVRVAWRSFVDVRGDPAAFALSWSGLFDRAVLPPPGIVPLAERSAAGAERVVDPAAGAPAAEARPSRGLAAWLALGAAGAALAAAAAAGRRT